MPERIVGTTHDQARSAAGPDTAAAGQTTVPTSLIDAVMDVDAAIDDGGLELQDALARMHEELAHIIPGSAVDAGAARPSPAPASPEQESSRT